MVTTTLLMGRPKKLHKTKHVRMHEEMADQIKMIAFRRGIDIADLLHTLFAPAIQTEYDKTIDEMIKQRKSVIDSRKAR